ncbi:MAG: hypothetical protein NXI27_25925 [Alphaproteobacteria bacterium]|nr:hypothetical protein [Alphaproteobacteria bacterium]
MKNFIIDGSVRLSIDGGEKRDIHNTFDFSQIRFDFQKMEACFVMTPYKQEHSDVIEISFINVSYFQFTENPFRQNCDAIDEVGYKRVGDHDLDWIMSESDYKDGDHFVLRLINGANLRIGAEKMIGKVHEATP